MEFREGRILKGVGGVYTVYAGGERHECRARGRFREQGVSPMAGDRVSFLPPDGRSDGYLMEILPRKNQLRRPAVSNVDRLAVVVSAGLPAADLLLVDRLLVDARRVGVEPLLAINKADEGDSGAVEAIAVQYRDMTALTLSAATGQAVEAFAAWLGDGTACLAGQSGVGKTSLINRLRPDYHGEVGSLGLRSDRGRHTTRHIELLSLPSGGWVVDTPGFSLLETDPIDPASLREYYPEFAPYEGRCRFADCSHDREAGCAVREAVARGAVHPERHRRYTELLHELNEKWRNRYESS